MLQVLNGLQQKSVLTAETVTELEACLKERDTLPAHPALSPVDPNNKREVVAAQTTPKVNGLDKRQIEQRIEEDRERHKRLRESIWAISAEEDGEFEKMWEEAGEIDQDDYLAAEEDAMFRRQALQVNQKFP